MKYDVTDGSVVNGIREPIHSSFILNKLPDFKVACEPEIKHYNQTNQSGSKTITLVLKYNYPELVNFNGKWMTFTLYLRKY